MARSGGHAGQNGMRSLIQHLGSGDFPRLRIGIAAPDGGRPVDVAAFVLGELRPAEREVMETVLQRASLAMQAWLADGIDKAMNDFNS